MEYPIQSSSTQHATVSAFLSTTTSGALPAGGRGQINSKTQRPRIFENHLATDLPSPTKGSNTYHSESLVGWPDHSLLMYVLHACMASEKELIDSKSH
jgi:hypothetical protein